LAFIWRKKKLKTEKMEKDIKTTMLKAVMERYGSLSTLKQALYENTDTVLVNLCK